MATKRGKNQAAKRAGMGCFAVACLWLLLSCDPYRKDKCEWYLEPEPKHREFVEKGWVSLCARNFELGRQQCFLQARLEFAEKVFGKKFRYSTLKLDEKSFPRKIIDLKVCSEN